jgi:8-amino-7-oxononanoate synthase
MDLDAFLGEELGRLDAANLRRRLRLPAQLDFASNDYLGLRRHPALIEAARQALAESGAGAGSSRLISGTDAGVLALEEALAAWKQKEAALVFGSGYAAAVGTIPALVGRSDTVILDKLAHASLIDAARLSGATVRTFRHNDVERLEALLGKMKGQRGRILIVTESIFSMDGDVAPLREIVELKERHGAWLLVDEAHATGLCGPTGAGLLEELSLANRVEIILATLSKALGGVGGMIAGSRPLVDWLINRARSFIFSTALPPGSISAGRAAVEVARGREGANLRERLRSNILHFRRDLPPAWREPASATGAIQPLICGSSERALELSSRLQNAGFFVPAIRYPTVPRLAARLRITLSAAHRSEDIDRLLAALGKLG